MSDVAAVVLAAGKGTRMKSRHPKVLHAVAGRPMIWHVLAALSAAGVPAERTAVVVSADTDGACVRQECESACPGLRFAVQDAPLGTGHAALAAKDVVPSDAEAVVVAYADTPLLRAGTVRRLLEGHAAGGHAITIVTGHLADPTGYGRIVRDRDGRIQAIVEERDASPEERRITEVNSGLGCYRAAWLWARLPQLGPSRGGEIYLTDMVAMAMGEGAGVASLQLEDITETVGVNTRVQLAAAAAGLRRRLAEAHMLAGVTLADPAAAYLDVGVEIGADTVILPNTHLLGTTRIGGECTIGPNAIVRDSLIGDRCHIVASVLDGAHLEEGVRVGPFAHLRSGTYLEAGAEIGTGGEVKNSRLGRGSKMHHFGYVGDAVVGTRVNLGAGSVTCNFDGVRKHRTTIGDGAFIGSDTLLVAPVEVGPGALTGAGAVVTRDVPGGTRVVGVPARPLPDDRRPTTEDEGRAAKDGRRRASDEGRATKDGG